MRALIVCLLVLLAPGCTSVGYKVGIADCAPVYGNWCGENYPIAGYNPRAVDEWDAACRTHDRCYDGNGSRAACDRALVRELESLSRERLSPSRMYNAHSWFRRDGSIVAWLQFTDEWWGMFASCKGGDGRAARFGCAVGWGAGCELDADDGPGRAGMPCTCGFYRGVIVER
jgi:hypothetical protein